MTFPLIERDYVETGLVRYIYRPYVVSLESDSDRLSAQALYCAGEQGKFWEMHDWLYFNADIWVSAEDVVVPMSTLGADEVGLDGRALESCLREERYRSRVEAIRSDADSRGVTGTPMFLVKDKLMGLEQGRSPFEQFQEAIGLQEDKTAPPGVFFGIAFGVPALVGLFLAGGRGSLVTPLALRLRMVLVVLALLGLLVATYLSLYELRISSSLICPNTGCEDVNRSEWVDSILGIPIAIFGVAGYTTILAVTLAQLKRRYMFRIPLGWIMIGLSGVGFLFSLFLTYLELFEIYAICMWCMVSAVLMTAIFGLSIAAWVVDQRDRRRK